MKLSRKVGKKVLYFSINILCCRCSARTKNSSISCAVGMFLLMSFRTLWLVSVQAVRRVVELGVPIESEALIKLQGVLSLVLLYTRTKTFYNCAYKTKRWLKNCSHLIKTHIRTFKAITKAKLISLLAGQRNPPNEATGF